MGKVACVHSRPSPSSQTTCPTHLLDTLLLPVRTEHTLPHTRGQAGLSEMCLQTLSRPFRAMHVPCIVYPPPHPPPPPTSFHPKQSAFLLLFLVLFVHFFWHISSTIFNPNSTSFLTVHLPPLFPFPMCVQCTPSPAFIYCVSILYCI